MNCTVRSSSSKIKHYIENLEMKLSKSNFQVSFARPSSDTIRGSNLYVSGKFSNPSGKLTVFIFQESPNRWHSTSWRAYFGHMGRLSRVEFSLILSRVIQFKFMGFQNLQISGLSKGVGFVRFDKKNEAEIAIEQLNGTIPSSCTEQITVKFANNPATNTAKNVLQEVWSIFFL